MKGLLADLHGAVHGLLRRQVLVGLAVLCFALGVGAGTSMSGILDSLLLRPPQHVEKAGALRRLYFLQEIPGLGVSLGPEASYPAFQDLQGVRAYSTLGAFFSSDVVLGRGGEARRVRAVLATSSFLALSGVRPRLGRLFTETEGQPGAPSPVVLISSEMWVREFGGATDILGRRVDVSGEAYAIVGVLPPGFTGLGLEPVDLWLPMNVAAQLMSPRWATSRGSKFLEIVGRLRPGFTATAAAEECTVLFRAAAAAAGRPQPTTKVLAMPVQRARGPDAPPGVRIATRLAGVSWIVLFLACVNVTHLLLVRGLERRHEFAVRQALGARPGGLARLMLLDSLVLAVPGGIAAFGVGALLSALLERLILPGAVPVATLDGRRLVLAGALSLLAGLLAGAIPALWASRKESMASLKSHPCRGEERRPHHSRWLAGLAAVQIAFTLALLISAAWFVHSLYNALHIDLGLDADRVVVATADFATAGLVPREAEEELHRAAEQVGRLPGVVRTALAATIPFESSVSRKLAVPGLEMLPDLPTGGPYLNAVSEDFFATTGTAVIRGRAFNREDGRGAARVAIVNRTLAHLLAPRREAIGQCVRIGGEEAPCATVVGVAEDARRSSLAEGPTAQVYVPLAQAPADLESRALFARVEGDPAAFAGAVGRVVQSTVANPDLLSSARSLKDLLAPQLYPWWVGTKVLALFGLTALALTLAGLYGVMSHTMARQTYELSIRTALGAPWESLLMLALRRGLMIALAGVGGGLLLVWAAGRFLAPLLFQVSVWDPLAFALSITLVLGVAVWASYAPSRRLRRLDAGAVLRSL